MQYLVLNPVTDIIENIIVCDEKFAAEIGAKAKYPGAGIGMQYEPTGVNREVVLAQQAITDLQLNDIEQGQQMTDLELMLLGGGTSV